MFGTRFLVKSASRLENQLIKLEKLAATCTKEQKNTLLSLTQRQKRQGSHLLSINTLKVSMGDRRQEKKLDNFPNINIVKAYQKVLNRSIEEGTFMVNHRGEVLNSKTEWNQPRLKRTTILQGGA